MVTALAPIRKTEMARRFTHGMRGVTEHRECWKAETLDGIWTFEREEASSTPWVIFHNPSVADGSFMQPVLGSLGSLRACQKAVARGWAERELESRKAEEAER